LHFTAFSRDDRLSGCLLEPQKKKDMIYSGSSLDAQLLGSLFIWDKISAGEGKERK
jgi:hypothetical protein